MSAMSPTTTARNGTKSGSKKATTTPATSDSQGKMSDKERQKQQDRINRKRIQNRISQQCIREKQRARSKLLESSAGIIKSTSKSDSNSNESMLNSQLALIDDNRDLRDALLRMRKKMLSLSSALATAADDSIFEKVLQKKSSKKKDTEHAENRQETPESPEPDEIDIGESGSQPPTHPVSFSSNAPKNGFPKRQIDLDGMPISELNGQDGGMEVSPGSSDTTIPLPSIPVVEGGSMGDIFVTGDSSEFTSEINRTQNMHNPRNFFDNSGFNEITNMALWNAFPPIDTQLLSACRFVQEDSRHESPNFIVCVDNTWKIEEACLWYLSEKLTLQNLHPSPGTLHKSRSVYDPLRAAIASVDHFDGGVLSDVAVLAIEILCKTGGFTQYIYGVGANKSMEKVMRWKLSPSLRNRLAITEPFRPTPLQLMVVDYPMVIDFINWPSIRDQLIFKLGTYDIDKVMADVVSNTVIEIPELRAAINIHDTFFTRVFSRTALLNSSSTRLNPFDSFFNESWESSVRGQPTYGWSIHDIVRQLSRSIQALEDSQSNITRLTAPMAWQPSLLSKQLSLQNETLPLSSKWGLDKLFRWKLSQEFAAANPFLDCSGVTASYPMYASKTVPEL